MFSASSFLILAALIPALLLFMATLIMKKSQKDREKASPFECGFDPCRSARLPFSLRFFLIAVIFLIFDVEIALLLPTPVAAPAGPPLIMDLTIISLIFIITLGLLLEWKNGALEWAFSPRAMP